MGEYRLSALLEGHEDDVGALSEQRKRFWLEGMLSLPTTSRSVVSSSRTRTPSSLHLEMQQSGYGNSYLLNLPNTTAR